MPGDCGLCVAILAARFSPNVEIYNTVLTETERFLVIPCIGPLTVGHVMVVSKEHHPNIATMGRCAIKEYEYLLSSTSEKLNVYGTGLLEAEHGALHQNSGGGCVIHTHVHWIPKHGQYEDILDSELQLMKSIDEMEELADEKRPYLFIRGRSKTIKLYVADDIPSQLIRRALTRKAGRSDWDWAVFPKYNSIADTVRLWKSISLEVPYV